MNPILLTTLAILAALTLLLVLMAPLFLPSHRRQKSYWLWSGCILASGVLYAAIGNPHFLWNQWNANAAAAEQEKTRASLEATLQQNPQDTASWTALGEVYLHQNRPGLAVLALKRAALLSEGDAEILLRLGKAQVIAARGTVSDEAAATLRMAQMQRPDPHARLLLAIHDAQHGRRAEARATFKSLAADEHLPPDIRHAAQEQLKQ